MELRSGVYQGNFDPFVVLHELTWHYFWFATRCVVLLVVASNESRGQPQYPGRTRHLNDLLVIRGLSVWQKKIHRLIIPPSLPPWIVDTRLDDIHTFILFTPNSGPSIRMLQQKSGLPFFQSSVVTSPSASKFDMCVQTCCSVYYFCGKDLLLERLFHFYQLEPV